MSQRNPAISKGVDWSLVWIWFILCSLGIMSIFAASYRDGDIVLQGFISLKTDYSRQLLFFILGGIAGIFILLTDSKFFTATANLGYAFGILLLLLVFPFHSRIKGTESIIKFGSAFNLQPADMCKIFVNLALAKYLSRVETNFTRPRSQIIAVVIALTPAMFSIMQSEMGLALVYFSFFLVMFREGLPSSVLIIGFSFAVLVVATLLVEPNTLALALTGVALLAIYILRKQIKRSKGVFMLVASIWFVCVGVQRFVVPFLFEHVFKPYQVQRIYALIGKDYVPKDQATEVALEDEQKNITRRNSNNNNYNVKQSKIAIGSGGLIGKGLLKGTQTRFDFVPEQRTDFIFCTIGEGFGFVGSMLFLGIYMLLLMRIVAVAERQRSVFSRCYAYGVASVLFFHIVINICMTIGLAPVIGIPLPFVSYGGTSLMTFSIMLFILVRLDADRQMVLR
ncbi:MAG: rod shape-determining protein RodA [Bacteroidota bacterium]|nr:rod shape-determining protein RodA [Bacteroidota bacterium]MDP4214891.1 rod shape-determining protein RodA [Bacteroidota bacterium]MDP4247357.1 rod shape-determining protein RodA [Bacteroidota bacterium]MDP4252387.1 rod shape-determining protein RodA [Bacteroidota bacterium]MDP4257944.1 rod shape-determining protein RodA [Bacteroidota bacterium]